MWSKHQCHTITLKGLGKEKKCLVENSKYKINNKPLPALKRDDQWKYPVGKTRRAVLIPQMHHTLALGDIKIGVLRKCDRQIRTSIKKWLGLPLDTSSDLIHAPVPVSGLGINSLRILAPLLRKERLSKLELPNFESTDFFSRRNR